MIRSRRFRQLGVVVLVTAFAFACYHVTRRAVQRQSRVTLRFAHWQLEGGIRDAFDAIARDYEVLHPGIHIAQQLIPETIYTSWGTTQIIGGVAPDLMEIGKSMGGPEVYSYFLPITEETDQRNPYNAGTPLAGLPWRNTYTGSMDGLNNTEIYGASVFASTTRIYYNVNLLREITGSEEPPRTFEQLLALCAQVRAHAARTGHVLAPLAGSRLYGIVMMDDLLRSQTQRLACEMNPGLRFPTDNTELYLAYLNRQWSLDHPGIRGGAELMRLVSREMPPGFMQFGREESLFYFVQGRALMLMAFSQDATSILRQVNFPVGVFRDPLPEPAATGFGANLVGPNSEGALNVYGPFGIPRSSPHPALAIDFLRFLTSQTENQKFSRLSGSLPVIVGVEPEGFAKNFMPDGHGFPPAPSLLIGGAGQAFLKQLHWLTGADASSDVFLHALAGELGAGMRADLDSHRRALQRFVALNDGSIEAARQMLRGPAAAPARSRKYQGLVENQNEQEATAYYIQLRLKQAGRMP
ncbi:MAG: ABC transporter substrate-binding protein [Opitutaceae bacterium]